MTEASFSILRSKPPFLTLDSSNYSKTININFSHCTHGASGRQLKLIDTADKIMMIWKFGEQEQHPIMSIPIDEILTNAAISSNSSYKLYYIDKEYPVWRLLTLVFVGRLDIEKREKKVPFNKLEKTTWLYILAVLTIMCLVFIVARQKGPNRD